MLRSHLPSAREIVLTAAHQQELSERVRQMERASHDVAMLTEALKALQKERDAALGAREQAVKKLLVAEAELRECRDLLDLADAEHREMEEELVAHEALAAAERDASAAKLRAAGDGATVRARLCGVRAMFPKLLSTADVVDVPAFCDRVCILLQQLCTQQQKPQAAVASNQRHLR